MEGSAIQRLDIPLVINASAFLCILFSLATKLRRIRQICCNRVKSRLLCSIVDPANETIPRLFRSECALSRSTGTINQSNYRLIRFDANRILHSGTATQVRAPRVNIRFATHRGLRERVFHLPER